MVAIAIIVRAIIASAIATTLPKILIRIDFFVS